MTSKFLKRHSITFISNNNNNDNNNIDDDDDDDNHNDDDNDDDDDKTPHSVGVNAASTQQLFVGQTPKGIVCQSKSNSH